ncbi:MAG: putative metal-binding motif-containing protein [Alphaproteobacteria bacterium]|nr:putative metal-binding motif-containing protein [Alphaproteobacteria bacterium]
MILFLQACLFIAPEALQARSDADGDGYLAVSVGGTDCDDADDGVHPGAQDPWYDGVDANCDGRSDYDQDGDGLDAFAYGGPDCDDTRRDVRTAATLWSPDCDGDDAPGPGQVESCGQPTDDPCGTGTVWIPAELGLPIDCDEGDPSISPFADDVPYDGVDSDCDGQNDYDADDDGYVEASFGIEVTDADAPFTGDCDDTEPGSSPGNPEIWYDGIDGDCAGGDDYDADGDGYRPAPYAGTDRADCNDGDPTVNPGATETWYDGLDDDCDGNDADRDGDGYPRVVDCDDDDPTRHPGAPDAWYDGIDSDCGGEDDADADGDGYRAPGFGPAALADCDDLDPAVHPGQLELWYDGVDADCAGDNDFDRDGDGFVALGFEAEVTPSAPSTGDCDDGDAARNPAVTDIWYDGIDSDCDGNDADRDGDGSPWPTDCDDDDPTRSPGFAEVFYDGHDADCGGDNDYDADGDGRVALGYEAEAAGTALLTGDCDDADSAVHPDAEEVWYDGLDANCDGANDFDRDGDGYTAPGGVPGGAAPLGGDCDDADPSVNPGATEVWYDGVDQDCDGSDDDRDGDGYPASTDCDDTEPAVHPGATDVPYDGVDSDCDGAHDFDADGDGHVALGFEAEAGGLAPRTGDCDDTRADVNPLASDPWYDGVDANCDGASEFDRDGDGFVWAAFDAMADGVTTFPGDCDDGDPFVNPSRVDVPYDGVDSDCGGEDDFDADGDGIPGMGVGPELDCDDGDPSVWRDAWGSLYPPPGSDLVEWIESVCGGYADLALVPGVYTLSREMRLDSTVSVGLRHAGGEGEAVVRGSGGHRLFDVAQGGTLELERVVLEGGQADAGGCLRLSHEQAGLYMTEPTFRDCEANVGGAIHTGAFFDLELGGARFVGNFASDRGGAIAGDDMYLSDQPDLWNGERPASFEGNRATFGGAISTNGYVQLALEGTSFAGDRAEMRGGALDMVGVVAIERMADISIVGAYAGGPGGALYFEGVEPYNGGCCGGGSPMIWGLDVVGSSAPVDDWIGGSIVDIFYSERISMADVRIVGGGGWRGLALRDTRDVSMWDVEVDGFTGAYGIDVARVDYLYASNVLVHDVQGVCTLYGPGSCDFTDDTGFRLEVYGGMDLSYVTSVHNQTPSQIHFVYPGSGSWIRYLVAGSTVGVGPDVAFLYDDWLEAYDSHALYGQPFAQYQSWNGQSTPFNPCDATGCIEWSVFEEPFTVPAPAGDAHVDPGHPLSALGDSGLSCAFDEACRHPGYWGGAYPPGTYPPF